MGAKVLLKHSELGIKVFMQHRQAWEALPLPPVPRAGVTYLYNSALKILNIETT